MGRYARINWVTFLIFSIGWELLELVLPFEFALETIGNKFGDIVLNVIGFSLGLRFRKSPQFNHQEANVDKIQKQ